MKGSAISGKGQIMNMRLLGAVALAIPLAFGTSHLFAQGGPGQSGPERPDRASAGPSAENGEPLGALRAGERPRVRRSVWHPAAEESPLSLHHGGMEDTEGKRECAVVHCSVSSVSSVVAIFIYRHKTSKKYAQAHRRSSAVR